MTVGNITSSWHPEMREAGQNTLQAHHFGSGGDNFGSACSGRAWTISCCWGLGSRYHELLSITTATVPVQSLGREVEVALVCACVMFSIHINLAQMCTAAKSELASCTLPVLLFNLPAYMYAGSSMPCI